MVTPRDGHAITVKTDTIIGDRYRIRGLISRGAMAEVYVATDLRLDRTVAVKLAMLDGPDVEAIDERTRQEMRALAGLDHPRVVRLLDAGRWDDRGYLVLEHVDGPSLSVRLRHGPLPLDEVARVAADTASALAYLHERGIVHRDVKPANILLDRDGHAHVADFGAARLLDAPTRLTATGELIGTASYLSPEQVRGDSIGPPTDVYSLGLVVLECLTGRREYDGTLAEAALARLTRSPLIDPDLPPAWIERIEAMTALDPVARVPAATVAEWFAPVTTPTLVMGALLGELPDMGESADTLALPAAARGGTPPKWRLWTTPPLLGRRPSLRGRRLSRQALAKAGIGAGVAAAAVTAAGVLSLAASHDNPGAGSVVTTKSPRPTTSVTPRPTPAAVTPSPTRPAPAPKPTPKKAPAKHDTHHGHGHHGG